MNIALNQPIRQKAGSRTAAQRERLGRCLAFSIITDVQTRPCPRILSPLSGACGLHEAPGSGGYDWPVAVFGLQGQFTRHPNATHCLDASFSGAPRMHGNANKGCMDHCCPRDHKWSKKGNPLVVDLQKTHISRVWDRSGPPGGGAQSTGPLKLLSLIVGLALVATRNSFATEQHATGW